MRYLIVAGALLALILTSSASAQEPTGSISGRISYEGLPDIPCAAFRWLFIVPTDEPQPIEFSTFESPFYVEVACDGTYSMSDLAAGEYLIAYDAYAGVLDGFDEELLVHWRGNQAIPAKLATLESGQDLVVDIAIRVPTPEPTPVPAPNSISGRVYHQGCDQCTDQFSLFVVTTDAPQPYTYAFPGELDAITVSTDGHGYYTSFPLADGEYFVVLLSPGVELSSEVTDHFQLQAMPTSTQVLELPAIRATISQGQGVRGIDFVIAPPPVIGDGLPPPTPWIHLPSVGSAGTRFTNFGAVVFAIGTLAVSGVVLLRLARR